jgi:penicillin-binding protein 1A
MFRAQGARSPRSGAYRMGFFRSRKSKAPRGRQEPRLYGNGKPAPRRAAERAPRARRRRGSLFTSLLSLGLSFAVLGTVVAGLGLGYIWTGLDKKGLLHIPDREPGVMLLASDGNVLAERGSFFGDEVRIDELPDYVPNAIIAIEDRRFRSHYGVDPWGLGRAMYENFKARQFVQGGSTLTQQLAKNLFLKPDRTFERKAQEMVLALWLENKFSKDELLQLYLNRVSFYGNAIGIEKAAQAFFGKSAREVSLQEAAILAAVLKAPSTYNPIVHPEAAAARSKDVLNDMVEVGFITAEEAKLAIETPLAVKPADYVPATQYIVDWTLEQLPSLLKTYDKSIIIETTINPEIQARAEKALRQRLNKEGAKLNVSQAAFVMMDTTGAIKSMVGGKSYVKSQFNRVTRAKRQPGSAFKPFVYLTAIEQGYTPESIEIDEPVKIGDWEPENYKRKYLGPVSLKVALARSLNTVAAKLCYNIGPEAVAATARRLGISSQLTANASIALGTSEVTLLELASAMAPFANGGAPVPPYIVKRITTRDGEVLYERDSEGFGQVVSAYDIGAMNVMMRAVVTQGTAKAAQFGDMTIAGKTGTSQDYRDAWFVGYTPYFVAGVWVGNDDNSPTSKVTGGSLPTLIWKDIMEPSHEGLASMPLPGDTEYQESSAPQVAYEPEYPVEPAPKRKAAAEDQGGGFFDRIFGGGDKPKKQGGGKKKTAFQRMQEEKGGQ